MDRLQAGDPAQIGTFRLIGRLGEGGMGLVYLGESPGGRKVAIKVVRPEYIRDHEFRNRFTREVAAARQVGGFHTAQVVAADPAADPPWMATAYIPGPSLAAAIESQGPLSAAAVRELGAALAEGLVAIHACGIIHRDLKPSNVILASDGPRIIDFGIAKSANATSLTGSWVVGTIRYMSPEQLRGESLTGRSDIFALGAVLTYAATGHDAFASPAHTLNDPPDLDPLTGELRDIIGACLAREPAGRSAADDLLARLNTLKTPGQGTVISTAVAAAPAGPAGPTQSAPPPAVYPRVVNPPLAGPPIGYYSPRRRRRPVIATVAGLVVVAGLAAGLVVELLGKHLTATPPAANASPVCATGSLQVIGSSAFMPIAQEAATAYANACSGAAITVTDGDSAFGLTQVRGAVQSRASSAGSMIAMFDGQPSAAATAGLRPYPMGVLVYYVVAHAGLYPSGNITTAELRRIFVSPGEQGKVAVGRRGGSGSRETFVSKVLGVNPGPPYKHNCPVPAGHAFSFTSCTEDSTADLLTFVNQTPNAIGYAEVSGPLSGYPQVSVISINSAGPTADNVRNGSYEFWTAERLYASTRPSALTRDFLSFLPQYLRTHLPRDFIPCAASLRSLVPDC